MATTTEFVTQLYTNIYGRAPTTLELNQQVGRIDLGGVTTSQVAAELIDSATGQNAQAITRIYLAAFGRYPDLGGLQVQENVVATGGATLKQLAVNFTATAEFATKFPSGTDATAYITALYTNVLGRTPDAAGLAVQIAAYNGYPGATADKQAEFLFRFAQSAELTTTRGGEIKAVVAYAAVDNSIPTLAQAQQASAIPLTTLIGGLNDGINGNGFGGTGGVSGGTYTLTTAIDALTGTTANDTFIAQLGATNTLQAADVINGGTGIDVLRLVTDGATATNSVGVTANGVEILEVQSQSTGGTTVDVTNFTGLTQVRSASSTQALAITGAKTALGYAITAGQTVNTVSIAGGAAGAADTASLALSGNTLTSFTYDGIETFSVNNLTTASTITTLASNTAKILQISGDAKLTITNAVAGVTTIDASTTTGGVVVTADGTKDVTFTGGSGADQITYAAGTFTATDSVNGGAGTDTLVVTFADLSGSSYAAAAKVSNVEVISFTDNLAGAYDSSKVTGDNTVVLQAGFTGGASVTGAASGFTVNNQAASTGALTVTVTDAALAANTTDVLNVAVGKAGVAGFSSGTITAAGVETVNIASTGGVVAGVTTVNSLTLGGADTTKVVITGTGALALTATTGTALATIDAGAATGAIDLTNVTNYKATGASITGGAGADILTGSAGADTISGGAGADVILGSLGADTITLGEGADSVRYSLVTQSTAGQIDTIVDFTSGTDSIDLTGIAAGRTIAFGGVGASFGQTQALIKEASGTLQVVYQADTNTIWVDANDDGALNNNDLQIVLSKVATITAADVKAGAQTAIVLSGTPATLSTTVSTNVTGGAKATTGNDFVQTTGANLTGATIDLAGGVDTVTVTDAPVTFSMAGTTLTNVETLALGKATQVTAVGLTALNGLTVTGDNTVLNEVAFAAGAVDLTSISFSGIDTVTTSAAATTVNQANLVALRDAAGGAVDSTLATGAFNINLAGATTFDFTAVTATTGLTTTGATGFQFNTAGAAYNLKVRETQDIVNYTNASAVVVGAVTIDALLETNKGITVNLTNGGAAYTAVATIVGSGGDVADTITTGSGNDVVTIRNANATIDTVTLGAGNDTLTANVANTLTAGAIVADGGTGTDTLTVAAGVNALTLTGGAFKSFETQNITSSAAISLTYADADFDAASTINILTNAAAVTIDASAETTQALTVNLTAGTAGVAESIKLGGTGVGTINYKIGAANALLASADVLAFGTGTSDVLNINLNGFDDALNFQGTASSLTGVETINLTGADATAGAAGAVLSVKSGATYQTGLKTIDASATTNGVTIALGDLATTGLTVTGGTGADKITTSSAIAGTYKIGNNDLIVVGTASNAAKADIINIGVTAGVVGQINVDATNLINDGSGFTFSYDSSAAGTNAKIAAIATSLANTGVAQVVITTPNTNTTLLQFDFNGNGLLDVGRDFQVTITGQAGAALLAGAFSVDASGFVVI